MKYFLGIDNGGTSTKAAIYGEDGSEIAVASESTRGISVRPGFAERDMTDMWRMNGRIIRSVLEKAGIRPQELAGIACCGHGKGLYLLDAEGKPVRNGILSADTRAVEYEKRWKADGTEAKAYERSLQHVMACQPVALLAWLRDSEPESVEKTRWILSCKDYIRFCLTGEALAERSDMSGNGLMNLRTQDYDPELLRIFGIEFAEGKLPPLCSSLDCCGHVTEKAAAETGLAAGTPVFGGMFDIDACALAVGAVTPKDLCMISGTWSINEFVSDAPVISGDVQMNSLFCLDGKYLIEESSATSAGNSEWFLRKILHAEDWKDGSIYARANALAEEIPYNTPMPVFLPFVMASNVNPDAMGSFIGLAESMDRRHLIRSVYEGVAFSHRWHYERLLPSRTEPVTEIRLSGGAAHSELWTQMFADILAVPVRTVQVQETGALGCAISAAAAAGCYASAEDAVRGMVRLSEPVFPDPSRKEYYDERYALYCGAIRCLDPVWSRCRAVMREYGGENETD